MTKLTIGVDPEFFLFDTKKEQYISAHDLVPGNKENPHKLKDGAVQLDGCAVEFNINPAADEKEFVGNINSVLSEIRDMIPNRFKFAFEPAVAFDPKYWDFVPATSKELGCSPDYNANSWDDRPQDPPKPPKSKPTMRTGAGHIHLGWTKVDDPLDSVHYWDCKAVINQFYSSYMKHKNIFDKDKDRSYMYGHGPVFRPKPYGCEFRTPSNAWLKYPKMYPWLFKHAVECFEHLQKNERTINTYYVNSYYVKSDAEMIKLLNEKAKQFNYTPFPTDFDKEVASW